MAISKVIFGNTTVIDITDSTVSASKLKSGETAYGADGTKITGSLVVPEVLDDLSDVVITSPQTAQEIYYDGTEWINYGAKIFLTFDDDFKGQTITLTKGQTTITKTAPLDSNTMNLYVNETGLWTISSTISGDTYETEVNVTTFGTSFDAELSSVPPTPEGATVEPTDDIQIWLACANLDKPYTTLDAVLADRETFETLIADSNACDYMARSTSWALAEGLVPVMTDNTHPSGECFSSYNSSSGAYKAFDNNWSSFDYASVLSNAVGSYIGYDFGENTKVNKITFRSNYTNGNEYIVQGYDTEWHNITSFIANGTVGQGDNASAEVEVVLSQTSNYNKYRVYQNTKVTTQTNTGIFEIQFYKADITTNQDAMALIGKYDYCSNALLNNATWLQAIAESDYKDSVLNISTPKMTSDTLPSGQVIKSRQVSSFESYKAFDKSISTFWIPIRSTTSIVGDYIGYKFDSPICIKAVNVQGNRFTEIVIEASNDNSTYSSLKTTNLGGGDSYFDKTIILDENVNSYLYYRIRFTSASSNVDCQIAELNFYGRSTNEVLVPLVPTMTSNTTPSGECIANGYISGYPEYYGFDKVIDSGNNAHCWAVAGTSGWLGYHFPRPVKVDQIVLTQRTESGAGQNQNVKTATIQYSDDGIVWVDDANGIQTYSQAVANTVNVAENNAHAYWRVNVASIYNDTAGAVAILELQFYQRTIQTNIVHSSANDTIYYMEDGSPVIVATTNSDGDGILDFSSLEDKEYTFYSSVAKDPSNLTNDFSKSIRITKSQWGGTTELYLMPSTINTLYWWGYEDSNLEDCTSANGWVVSYSYVSLSIGTAPTHNTNSIRISTTTSTISGVGTKNTISATKFYCLFTPITVTGASRIILTQLKSAKYLTNQSDKYEQQTGSTTAPINTLSMVSLTSSLNNKYFEVDTWYGTVTDINALWYE